MLVISNWRGSFKEVHIALLLPRKWQLLSVGFGDHIAVLSSNLLGTISHIQFGGQVITIHLSASQCCDTFSSQDPLDFRDGISCLFSLGWQLELSHTKPGSISALEVPCACTVSKGWAPLLVCSGHSGSSAIFFLVKSNTHMSAKLSEHGILKRKKTQCLELTHFPN